MTLLLLLLLILPSLLIVGRLYQMIGNWIDERRFPPPGRLVDIGACKLHLKRQGSGQPVVVLEAGIAATSISWSLVQTRIAQSNTVCSYGWPVRLNWAPFKEMVRRAVPITHLEPEFQILPDLVVERHRPSPVVLRGQPNEDLLSDAVNVFEADVGHLSDAQSAFKTNRKGERQLGFARGFNRLPRASISLSEYGRGALWPSYI